MLMDCPPSLLDTRFVAVRHLDQLIAKPW